LYLFIYSYEVIFVHDVGLKCCTSCIHNCMNFMLWCYSDMHLLVYLRCWWKTHDWL